MKINKHKEEFKKALALQREADRLEKLIRNAPSIKLARPIAHGYVRSFQIRPEFRLHKQFAKIEEAFLLCGQSLAYHKNINFLKKSKRGVVEQHATLNSVLDPRFKFYWTEDRRAEDLAKIKSAQKYLQIHDSLFVCNCRQHRDEIDRNRFRIHYFFSHPWMLEEITRQHYLTHYKEVDGEVESRLAFVYRQLQDREYYRLLSGRRHWRNDSWHEIKHTKNGIYHGVAYGESESA